MNIRCQNSIVQNIIKSLNLTRTLDVASILIGESATGKRTLVRTLFPDLPRVNGADQEAVEAALTQSDALVIEHYEKLSNPDQLDFDNKQIIAIADYAGNPQALDATFGFIYTLPPLRERPEDVPLYATHFQAEAQETLMIPEAVTLDPARFDLRHNLRSLRASIHRELLLHTCDKPMIEQSLRRYFLTTLPHHARYHDHLGLFEKPLLEAGLEVFGSQLRLAEALGINRNTLRKKIHEHL
jgi:DNA-binding protein Fis